MARSTYIYVVCRQGFVGMSVVVACFTVKHELVSWLKRQDDSSLESCHVVRYSDGARRFPQFVDSARGVRDS